MKRVGPKVRNKLFFEKETEKKEHFEEITENKYQAQSEFRIWICGETVMF